MDNSPVIDFQVAEAKDLSAIVELVTKTFCETEPTTTALGLTESDYRPFAEYAVANGIASGLSHVAVDGNGEIVGVTIAEDWANRGKIPTSAVPPRMKPLVSLLETLQSQFQPGEVASNTIAYGWITAIKPGFQNLGLGPKINGVTLNHKRAIGFRYSYAEFTNPRNARFAANLPSDRLRHISSVPYSDFEFEGRKPFSALQGEASSYIFSFAQAPDFENYS